METPQPVCLETFSFQQFVFYIMEGLKETWYPIPFEGTPKDFFSKERLWLCQSWIYSLWKMYENTEVGDKK
jgi:hypothetical protein